MRIAFPSRLGAVAGLILASTACSAGGDQPETQRCASEQAYCPSIDQQKVDASFSPFAINQSVATYVDGRTVFNASANALGGLTEIGTDGCERFAECDFADASGVRHYLWGDPSNLYVVLKIVHADEFVGRPISALGIGTSRRQEDVLANVRQFLPGVEIDCDSDRVSGNVGPIKCGFSLDPGWVQIGFDRQGNLMKVRFDGYHFT